MNQHKPEKRAAGMTPLSLLRLQDNTIEPKWYEDTTGLGFDCLEDDDMHTVFQSTCLYMNGGTRQDILHIS